MEEYNQETHDSSFFDLNISDSVIYSLQQTCRWALFLAYVSGIGIVLGFLCLSFAWSYVDRLLYQAYGGGSENILFGAIMFVMLIYAAFVSLLFTFAYKIKQGVMERNMQKIEQGVASMKFYFIISGIFGMLSILFSLFTFFRASIL